MSTGAFAGGRRMNGARGDGAGPDGAGDEGFGPDGAGPDGARGDGAGSDGARAVPGGAGGGPGDDTVELDLRRDAGGAVRAPSPCGSAGAGAVRPARTPGPAPCGDLLDGVAGWGAAPTPFGRFAFVPVDPARDLDLLARWMNDPAVSAFWELQGPPETTRAHIAAQLDGDGRSVPCLGVLDGAPVSYWEVYRADLDPLARYYPARPHDTGLHLLIGGVTDRGRGLGTALLRAAADLVLDHRPACARVVAEPDLRNTPSVAAFLGAGFRLSAEVRLPDKDAALMLRERALRDCLGPGPAKRPLRRV